MRPGALRSLVLAALLLVLLITTTSAYIRLSQAGLGCADWPTCYDSDAARPAAGQIIPERSPLFWARALHRVAASAAGIVLLLIVVLGWDALRGSRGRAAAVLAVGLAGFLAWLGQLTPSPLPAVTIGNLLGGMVLFALLWWLHQGSRPTGTTPAVHWLGLAMLTLQVALGGMIGARHALLTCDTLPRCAGRWWPAALDGRLFDPFLALPASEAGSAALGALVMAHRYGALVVALVLGALALSAIRRGAGAAARGWFLLVVLGLQGLLGAGMTGANFPLPLALLHNLGATLLLGATVGLSGRECATPEEP